MGIDSCGRKSLCTALRITWPIDPHLALSSGGTAERGIRSLSVRESAGWMFPGPGGTRGMYARH